MSSQTPKSQKNILDLPPEILRMIFQRIFTTEDLRNCQKACEVYNDSRISNIKSLIQFENEGTILQLCFHLHKKYTVEEKKD